MDGTGICFEAIVVYADGVNGIAERNGAKDVPDLSVMSTGQRPQHTQSNSKLMCTPDPDMVKSTQVL